MIEPLSRSLDARLGSSDSDDPNSLCCVQGHQGASHKLAPVPGNEGVAAVAGGADRRLARRQGSPTSKRQSLQRPSEVSFCSGNLPVCGDNFSLEFGSGRLEGCDDLCEFS